jgi:hypothetical protein
VLTFLKIISSENEGAGCTTYHTSAENTEMLLCAEFNAMVSGETVDIRL